MLKSRGGQVAATLAPKVTTDYRISSGIARSSVVRLSVAPSVRLTRFDRPDAPSPGSSSRLLAGAAVQVQRQGSAGTWTTVATTNVTADGAFEASVDLAAGQLSRSRDRRPGLRGRALAGADRGVGVKRLLAVAALALTVAGTAAAAVTSTPNDPLLSRQWYLGRDHALDTFDAAKQLFTVRVAVIDSGVELGHPELKNRIVAHRSFVGGTVADTIGHGTFVAGEIAAIADNSAGIAGIASVGAPGRRQGRPATTARSRPGPRRARSAGPSTQGARVINLSLGSTRDPTDPSVDGYSPVEQRRSSTRSGRRARRRGRGKRQRRAREAVALGELPGRLPARARRRGLRRLGGVPSFSNRDDRFVDLTRPAMGIFSLFPRPLTATFATCLEQGYSSCGTQDYRHARRHLVRRTPGHGRRGLLFGEEPSLRPDQVSEILKLTASDATPANGCADCSVGTGLAERLRPARRERCPRLAPGASADARPLRAQRRRRRPGRGRLRQHGRHATLDWWDDPNDVYRIHLGQGAAALGARARRPATIDPSIFLWKPGLHALADARSDLRARRAIHGPGVPERIRFKAPARAGTRCR